MEVASHEGKSRKVTRAKDVPVGDSQYSDPPAAIAVSDRGGRPELPSISDREGRKGRSFRRRDVTSRPMPDMLSALLAALLEVSMSMGFAMRRGQMAPSPRCGIRTSGGDLTGSADGWSEAAPLRARRCAASDHPSAEPVRSPPDVRIPHRGDGAI